MTDPAPQYVDTVTLDEDEVELAAVAVRMYLANVRHSYRKDVSRGQVHYAASKVRKFDDLLDLYERLGGDADRVLDLNERGPAR